MECPKCHGTGIVTVVDFGEDAQDDRAYCSLCNHTGAVPDGTKSKFFGGYRIDCPTCGTKNLFEAIFCVQCGRRFR